MSTIIIEGQEFWFKVDYRGTAGRQIAGYYPNMEYEIDEIYVGSCKTPEGWHLVPHDFLPPSTQAWLEECVQDDLGANAGPDPDYLFDSARDDALVGGF
jgi:hypothetical protein